MRVFEFQFNPKVKEDVVYDTFCFEPENTSEEHLGSLYLAGELKNTLPQNSKFLEKLSEIIKKEYYSALKETSEDALRESLKSANEFLSREAKRGNVSWMGNLNLSIIAVKDLGPSPVFSLNFTKVGEIKILLFREKEILDIGQNLEFQIPGAGPLKTFENIVTGKVAANEKIIVLTRDIFDFFLKENLIQNLFLAENEKEIRKILKSKEKELLRISGLCLFLALTPSEKLKREVKIGKKMISLLPNASLKMKDILKFPVKIFSKIKIPTLIKKPPTFSKPQTAFQIKKSTQQISQKVAGSKIQVSANLKKGLILSLALILILLLGFFIFKGEKEKEIKLARESLERIEVQITQAENFLILNNEEKANEILKSGRENLLPQTKPGAPLQKTAIALKSEIEEKLFSLNKIENIPAPVLLFEIPAQEINLVPQKMVTLENKLYFFNPFSSNFYQLNIEEKTGTIFNADKNLKLATTIPDSILFFAEPNTLILFKENNLQEKQLGLPSADFGFNFTSNFGSGVYFLDKNSGEIVKYNVRENEEELSPETWLKETTEKKAINAISMAIDENIWVLNKEENITIERYYLGLFKDTISLNIFPELENPTKIWTSPQNPYFYILEPKNNRLIILNKQGEIFKQYQSEKFNHLLDFALSEDGKTIYVLNSSKVYQIEME